MTVIRETVRVSMSDAAKDVLLTIKVKHEARFWFRMWLMTRLLKLAAWVAPVSVQIESEA